MIRVTLFLLILFFSACSDDPINEDCPDRILVNDSKYQSIEDHQGLFIQEMEITDDCLRINIGFSGCDDGHTINMVTDGSVAESFPVQVRFKLEDKNPQACQAFFVKDFFFDLHQLDAVVGDEPSARLIFPLAQDEILWERN